LLYISYHKKDIQILLNYGTTKEFPSDKYFHRILGSKGKDPVSRVIYESQPGKWDENIREQGNVVNFNGIFYTYYSGYKGNYPGNFGNVYVGVLKSEDGKNWNSMGKAFDVPSEDPYVVIDQHTEECIMYFEGKNKNTWKEIKKARSKDCVNFIVDNSFSFTPVLIAGRFDNKQVASPVSIDQYLIYEGLGEMYGIENPGVLGLSDINNKRKLIYPGRTAFWESIVVPDDIMKKNDTYFLSYHAWDGVAKQWVSNVIRSKDLLSWKASADLQPVFNFLDLSPNGIHFFDKGKCVNFIAAKKNKIYEFYSESLKKFNIDSCGFANN